MFVDWGLQTPAQFIPGLVGDDNEVENRMMVTTEPEPYEVLL